MWLLNARKGSIIKKTIFKYPNDKYFGSFIRKIIEKIESAENISILYDIKDSNINNSLKTLTIQNELYRFGKYIWTGELANFKRNYSMTSDWSSQEELKSDLDLFFLSVNEGSINNKFSVLLYPESEFPFYRVTNQTICSAESSTNHKIILESGSLASSANVKFSNLSLNKFLSKT